MWLSHVFVVQFAVHVLATSAVLGEPAATAVPAQVAQAQNDTSLIDAVGRLAVAWVDMDSGVGVVRGVRAESPWPFDTTPLETGPESVLHAAGDWLYVVSSAEGTVTIIDADTWSAVQTHSTGVDSEPLDIAVVSPELAYVTRRSATHLLRLDLTTGATEEVVDLSFLADEDGVPDMGMMAMHEGRLFVQIRRLGPPSGQPVPPAYLAVVDLASETLIDVDPTTEGVQAIELEGTAPKYKMQIVPETRRLFVSASGFFWDEGGLEMIDLDALQSLGLVLREADGLIGVDLLAFVLVAPDRGYLTFSTDFAPSSHLTSFTLEGEVNYIPFETVGYFTPTLGFDSQSNTIFFPDGGKVPPGVYVLDAATGALLTPEPIPTTGHPTDLVLIAGGSGDEPVPALSGWGLAVTGLLLLTSAALILARRARRAGATRTAAR
ncbi:MAG: YncE family protein [Planctomycetota bacterium]|jgi:hypothetical protein